MGIETGYPLDLSFKFRGKSLESSIIVFAHWCPPEPSVGITWGWWEVEDFRDFQVWSKRRQAMVFPAERLIQELADFLCEQAEEQLESAFEGRREG